MNLEAIHAQVRPAQVALRTVTMLYPSARRPAGARPSAAQWNGHSER